MKHDHHRRDRKETAISHGTQKIGNSIVSVT